MEIKQRNLEAERAIIGAIFRRPPCIEEIRGELSLSDFTDEKCQAIYKACLDIAGRGELKGLDLITVKSELDRAGDLDQAGGETFLISLIDAHSTSAGVMYYVKQVKEARATKRLMDLYAQAEDDLRSGIPIEQTLIDFRNSLEKMTTGGFTGIDPFEPLTKHLADKYDRDMSRDPDKPLGYGLTKFEGLAKNIDGIQPGFYIVAADTNAGKTSFLCNLTLDLLDSNEDLTGIYFSLDDSRDVILNRFLSIKTGIPLNRVQRPQPEKYGKLLRGGYDSLTDLAKGGRLFIRDMSEIQNIQSMEIEIKRRIKIEGHLFVVVDALYNLDIGLDTDTRRENIERANRLKALSNIYQIPVICTGELVKSSKRIEVPPFMTSWKPGSLLITLTLS
jgi:replicative DNA helicase